ncbi:hypothetical protein GGTG_10737 [Gaeumannomyces tritici R3-111a-1]|uniref:Uncharacterized protein n=1 Tax=Gaeumannomyces tritici (strain R3-111a-1) TaxID=644352 RepID=J3PB64_GAET3|nr:hypothetical protein GGTG_10737 [Gaeumannomyces tritici R3-111a-1]EJT71480.1 hypothetical protein GGTG_10737 [Gaeumannomyces tritici R3-111a-1]
MFLSTAGSLSWPNAAASAKPRTPPSKATENTKRETGAAPLTWPCVHSRESAAPGYREGLPALLDPHLPSDKDNQRTVTLQA